jgi:hypothetical protein
MAKRGKPIEGDESVVPVYIGLEPSVIERVKELAKADRRPLSQYIRLVVDEHLAMQDEAEDGGTPGAPGRKKSAAVKRRWRDQAPSALAGTAYEGSGSSSTTELKLAVGQ